MPVLSLHFTLIKSACLEKIVNSASKAFSQHLQKGLYHSSGDKCNVPHLHEVLWSHQDLCIEKKFTFEPLSHVNWTHNQIRVMSTSPCSHMQLTGENPCSLHSQMHCAESQCICEWGFWLRSATSQTVVSCIKWRPLAWATPTLHV